MSRTKAVSLYGFLDDYCVLLFNDEWYAIAKRVAAVIMHDTTAPIQSLKLYRTSRLASKRIATNEPASRILVPTSDVVVVPPPPLLPEPAPSAATCR